MHDRAKQALNALIRKYGIASVLSEVRKFLENDLEVPRELQDNPQAIMAYMAPFKVARTHLVLAIEAFQKAEEGQAPYQVDTRREVPFWEGVGQRIMNPLRNR